MLGAILEHYISEDLGKQILKKLPYCLAIALAVSLLLDAAGSGLTPLLPIVGTSSLIFLASTAVFMNSVNKPMKDLFSGLDLKKLVAKLRSIYEQGDSLLSDIDVSKNIVLLLSGFANGISFSILLTSIMLWIIQYSRVGLEMAVVGIVLVLVYLTHDVARAPIVEEPETGKQALFGSDMIEKYALTNSMQRSPRSSRSMLYVLSRLFGPLVYINVPKFSCDASLVYENPDLIETLSGLTKESGKEKTKGRDKASPASKNMFLKQEQGKSASQFFVSEGESLRLTQMVEESPKKIFPYLLDPNSPEEGKGWIAFAIVQANPELTVGHVFIQKFRNVYIKTTIHAGRGHQDIRRGYAWQFIFMGERSYVQYLKNLVEVNSARVPPYVFDKEYQP